MELKIWVAEILPFDLPHFSNWAGTTIRGEYRNMGFRAILLRWP